MGSSQSSSTSSTTPSPASKNRQEVTTKLHASIQYFLFSSYESGEENDDKESRTRQEWLRVQDSIDPLWPVPSATHLPSYSSSILALLIFQTDFTSLFHEMITYYYYFDHNNNKSSNESPTTVRRLPSETLLSNDQTFEFFDRDMSSKSKIKLNSVFRFNLLECAVLDNFLILHTARYGGPPSGFLGRRRSNRDSVRTKFAKSILDVLPSEKIKEWDDKVTKSNHNGYGNGNSFLMTALEYNPENVGLFRLLLNYDFTVSHASPSNGHTILHALCSFRCTGISSDDFDFEKTSAALPQCDEGPSDFIWSHFRRLDHARCAMIQELVSSGKMSKDMINCQGEIYGVARNCALLVNGHPWWTPLLAAIRGGAAECVKEIIATGISGIGSGAKMAWEILESCLQEACEAYGLGKFMFEAQSGLERRMLRVMSRGKNEERKNINNNNDCYCAQQERQLLGAGGGLIVNNNATAEGARRVNRRNADADIFYNKSHNDGTDNDGNHNNNSVSALLKEKGNIEQVYSTIIETLLTQPGMSAMKTKTTTGLVNWDSAHDPNLHESASTRVSPNNSLAPMSFLVLAVYNENHGAVRALLANNFRQTIEANEFPNTKKSLSGGGQIKSIQEWILKSSSPELKKFAKYFF